jgi:hypothetical protein
VTAATRIAGVDLSLNHAGFVVLDGAGRIVSYDFVTSLARRGGKGVLLDLQKASDRHQHQLARLDWWRAHLYRVVEQLQPTHIGLEDYAHGSQGQGAVDTHELGGIARGLFAGAALLRLHNPSTVKLYAGAGNATGAYVAAAARAIVGPIFAAANPPAGRGKPNTLPEEDLAAAYTIARLVWHELELRAGRVRLEDLDENARAVFLRVTKSNPVGVLSRPGTTSRARLATGAARGRPSLPRQRSEEGAVLFMVD